MHDYNPARRIESFATSAGALSQRQNSPRLGAALHEAVTVGIPYDVDETKVTARHAPKPQFWRVVVAPDAIAAIRLLLLTGCSYGRC